MTPKPDIASVNLAKRLAVLDDGRIMPVTVMFDADGQETEDHGRAVSFVAGEVAEWFSALTSAFEPVATQ